MKKDEKGFANLVLIGVIVLLVAVGGYLAWKKDGRKNTKQKSVVVKTDNMSDWKTYTNTKYGFEFKYPTDMLVSDGEPNIFHSGTQPSNLGSVSVSSQDGARLLYMQIFNPDIVKGDYGWPERPCGEWTFGPDDKALSSQQTAFAGQKTLHFVSNVFSSGTSNVTENFYCIQSVNPLVISYDQSQENKIKEILSSFKFIEPVKQTAITILVPKNIDNYKDIIFKEFEKGYNKANKEVTLSTELYTKKQLTVPDTSDIIKKTAQAATEVIPTQGGKEGASIVYFKIQDNTVYVMISMQLDGWAGVSYSIAMIEPIIEKNLLQFPQIKHVVFDVAPGDNINNITW